MQKLQNPQTLVSDFTDHSLHVNAEKNIIKHIFDMRNNHSKSKNLLSDHFNC